MGEDIDATPHLPATYTAATAAANLDEDNRHIRRQPVLGANQVDAYADEHVGLGGWDSDTYTALD